MISLFVRKKFIYKHLDEKRFKSFQQFPPWCLRRPTSSPSASGMEAEVIRQPGRQLYRIFTWANDKA